MKSKTLIGVAVASTFGWAAIAHAGSGHHATSAAPEAQYPSMAMYESQGSESRAVDSTEMPVASTGASEWDSYIIADSYLVALEPADTILMLDDGASSDMVLLLDDGPYILSAYEVILLPSDFEEANERSGIVTSEEPAG